MSIKRIVLITGASSGIGRAMAQMLVEQDFIVYGTSRYPERVTPVADVNFLPLDVRVDESVQLCVERVLAENGRIDVLINNAGYELGGAIEETSLTEAQAQMETNFFGIARMVKAVLPYMRQQKRGYIINISSIVGWLVPAPFLGFYAASKMAVEGYTEVLRHEVKPLGIHVSLVEPGFIQTNLGSNRQMATQTISDYASMQKRAMAVIEKNENDAAPPYLVAETVLQIIKNKTPRLRYRAGQGTLPLAIIRKILPETQHENGMRRFFQLDK